MRRVGTGYDFVMLPRNAVAARLPRLVKAFSRGGFAASTIITSKLLQDERGVCVCVHMSDRDERARSSFRCLS